MSWFLKKTCKAAETQAKVFPNHAMIPLALNDTLGIRNSWEWGFRQNMFPFFLPGFYSEAALPPISSLFAFENRKKHARTPLDGENGGKTKASTQKQLCFPSPCFLLEQLHEGGISGSVKSDQRHSALGPCGACGALHCRVYNPEQDTVCALLCLWSSTIQNRTRIEFPEI